VRVSRSLVVAAALFACVLPARANTYNFTCITNNSPVSCGIAVAQLSVTVTAVGTGQVQFQFNNVGFQNSSIADIYFQSGSFISPPLTITNGPGVNFSVVATPANLPGGNPFGFTTNSQLTADSNPPVQPNGVNPGEYLIIVANLSTGNTYADLINALNNGTVLIGIHVQGFSNGQSESLVNAPPPPPPPTPVPEPASLALFSTGLVTMAGVIRRRLTS